MCMEKKIITEEQVKKALDEILNEEMSKEFKNIPINHDQSVIDTELLKWRALRVEILALETHEEIEAFEANN